MHKYNSNNYAVLTVFCHPPNGRKFKLSNYLLQDTAEEGNGMSVATMCVCVCVRDKTEEAGKI